MRTKIGEIPPLFFSFFSFFSFFHFFHFFFTNYVVIYIKENVVSSAIDYHAIEIMHVFTNYLQ